MTCKIINLVFKIFKYRRKHGIDMSEISMNKKVIQNAQIGESLESQSEKDCEVMKVSYSDNTPDDLAVNHDDYLYEK